MKKIIGLGALVLSMTGCFADLSNDINKRGGLVGTYKADYIIVNTTGNMILDVYKLKDTYVADNKGSDGVNFENPLTGSHVTIQGDVKIIRNPTSKEWDKYKEYHADEIFMESVK